MQLRRKGEHPKCSREHKEEERRNVKHSTLKKYLEFSFLKRETDRQTNRQTDLRYREAEIGSDGESIRHSAKAPERLLPHPCGGGSTTAIIHARTLLLLH